MRPVAMLLAALLAAAAAAAAPLDTVAVVVNGVPITASEVSGEAAFVAATGLTPVDPEIGEGEVIDQMILALLIRQRAAAIGLAVEDAEVTAAVGRVAANNRLTADQLEEKLMDGRGTWERFRGRIADRLLQPRLLDREVADGVVVTDAEVAAEYESRRSEFQVPEEIRVSHLLFPLPAEPTAEQAAAAEALAAAAKGRLAGGARLEAVVTEAAGQGGSGGDLGWFRRGELHPALEAAAFPLAAGGIAGPVRTPAGFHVLTITERREARTVPLGEAKGELARGIHRRKMAAAVRGYVEKLRAEAVIRYPR